MRENYTIQNGQANKAGGFSASDGHYPPFHELSREDIERHGWVIYGNILSVPWDKDSPPRSFRLFDCYWCNGDRLPEPFIACKDEPPAGHWLLVPTNVPSNIIVSARQERPDIATIDLFDQATLPWHPCCLLIMCENDDISRMKASGQAPPDIPPPNPDCEFVYYALSQLTFETPSVDDSTQYYNLKHALRSHEGTLRELFSMNVPLLQQALQEFLFICRVGDVEEAYRIQQLSKTWDLSTVLLLWTQ